jgi:hypothetical protein
MNQTTTSLFGQMMDSIGECFTPEVAARIVALRASEELILQRKKSLALTRSVANLEVRS